MTLSSDVLLLAKMLDDPDDRIGVGVIARLLQEGEDLEELSAMLQESSDPVIRRRAHWLQHALNMRDRRRRVGEMLEQELDEDDVIQILVDLHLLWFDTDTEESVRETMECVLECVRKNTFNDLETLSHWMIGSGMKAEPDTTIIPELYCAGSIFSSYRGAASLLRPRPLLVRHRCRIC